MMGGRNYKKPGDRRSDRQSRTDPFVTLLLRGVPHSPPRYSAPKCIKSAPIEIVLARVRKAHRLIREALKRDVPLVVHRNGFSELVDELVGTPSKYLACSGLYVLHAAQGSKDVLYVGAGGGVPVRHRLIAHVASGGTKDRMGQCVVRMSESWTREWRRTGRRKPAC